jgi:hypothetical protein
MTGTDSLAHAREQFDIHKEQVRLLSEQVRAHTTKAQKWEQYLTLHTELFGETDSERATISAPAVRRPVAPRTGAQTGAIAETRAISNMILEEAADYVPTGELLDKLVEYGIEIGGINPASTLSARLSGDEEIASKRGRGYILKKFLQFADAVEPLLDETPAASTSTHDSADKDGPGDGA